MNGEDIKRSSDFCYLGSIVAENGGTSREVLHSSKTEEIWFNTIVNQGLRLNGEDIRRSSDFCYLGSIVAENGGTSREVNARIEKARGSFSKLRRV